MTEETIQYLPLAKIATDDNIRKAISKEELHGLMESLRAVGQLQPIRVRLLGSVFKTTDGARRVLAAREAGWERIAAIVECDDGGAAAAKQRSLIANCQRADFTPMEIAEGVSGLMTATGWNASDTAVQLGFSSAKVSRLLALRTLPDTIKREIRDGRISASSGTELSRIEDPALQAALADEITAGRMTRDGVSGAAKAARKRPSRTSVGTVSRASAKLGDGRSVSVLGRALTLESIIEILEDVLSRARRARTQGLTLPTFLKVLRETKT